MTHLAREMSVDSADFCNRNDVTDLREVKKPGAMYSNGAFANFGGQFLGRTETISTSATQKPGSRTPTPPLDEMHPIFATGVQFELSHEEEDEIYTQKFNYGGNKSAQRMSYASTCATMSMYQSNSTMSPQQHLSFNGVDVDSNSSSKQNSVFGEDPLGQSVAVGPFDSTPLGQTLPLGLSAYHGQQSTTRKPRGCNELNDLGTPSTTDATPMAHLGVFPIPSSCSFPAMTTSSMAPLTPTFSVTTRMSNVESNKKHNDSARSLSLSEYSAPWPTSATALRSPKFNFSDYHTKLDRLVKEFFLSGDYQAFSEQLWQIRSETYNDTTVAKIFREGLEQPEIPRHEVAARDLSNANDSAAHDASQKDLDFCGEEVSERRLSLATASQAPPSWELLLIYLMEHDFVTNMELMRGLYGFISNMTDLQRDVPKAPHHVLNFIEMLVDRDLVDSAVFYRLPEDVLLCAKPSSPAYRVASELRVYKKIMSNALNDYFQTENFSRLAQILEDVSMNLFSHELVKRIVLQSLDMRHDEESRSNMVIGLIQKLFTHKPQPLIGEEDLQHGLALVLGRLEDISIDVPHAVRYVSRIFTDLVLNEILAADLVKREQNLQYGSALGVQVCTNVLHNTPEYSRKIWSGAGDESCMLQEMDLAVEEYFDSYDCEEVARIFGELHLTRDSEIRFIRKIILRSIEKRNVWVGLNLLVYLHDILWGTRQIEDAIESLRTDSDNLSVDLPELTDTLSYMVAEAHRYGLVSDEYLRLDQHFQV